MLEKLKNSEMADYSNVNAKEFRLVINRCWDIHGDNPEKNCIPPGEDLEKELDNIYVDVITLS
jgi:hypothetical protein